MTWIYLSPTTFVVLLMSIVNNFKVFKEVYMLYGAYPDPDIYMLQHYMNNQFLSLNMQKLSSAAYILFLVIGILLLIVFYAKSASPTPTSEEGNAMAKRHILPTVLIAIAAIVALFPIVFTVASSFMSGTEIADRYTAKITETNANDFSSSGIHFVRFGLIPEQPTLEQYKELLLNSPDYLRMFWNSVLLVVPVLIGQCILAPLAAFDSEIARPLEVQGGHLLYVHHRHAHAHPDLAGAQLHRGWVAGHPRELPCYHPARHVPPVGVFLVRQQLKNFPKECWRRPAGRGRRLPAYRYIVRPNLTSVIAALAVLLFADNWNIVDQAVVFLKETFDNPLSVYLGTVVSGDPGMFFAVSVFYLIRRCWCSS